MTEDSDISFYSIYRQMLKNANQRHSEMLSRRDALEKEKIFSILGSGGGTITTQFDQPIVNELIQSLAKIFKHEENERTDVFWNAHNIVFRGPKDGDETKLKYSVVPKLFTAFRHAFPEHWIKVYLNDYDLLEIKTMGKK